MKYWKKADEWAATEGITLASTDRVIVLDCDKDSDSLTFSEGCDGHFSATYTKQGAIELLEEAIQWIKSKD